VTFRTMHKISVTSVDVENDVLAGNILHQNTIPSVIGIFDRVGVT